MAALHRRRRCIVGGVASVAALHRRRRNDGGVTSAASHRCRRRIGGGVASASHRWRCRIGGIASASHRLQRRMVAALYRAAAWHRRRRGISLEVEKLLKSIENQNRYKVTFGPFLTVLIESRSSYWSHPSTASCFKQTSYKSVDFITYTSHSHVGT